ncbi:MAG: hypothetical protein V8S10_06510 [Clostridia bacterium]
MMKYQVVIENSMDKLEAEVNKLLSEGWRPQGGISMMVAPNFEQRYGRISVILQTSSFRFAQALVKD